MTLVRVSGEEENEGAWRDSEIYSYNSKNRIKIVQDHCHLTLETSHPDLLCCHITDSRMGQSKKKTKKEI